MLLQDDIVILFECAQSHTDLPDHWILVYAEAH